jgi:hypothetical protein
MHYSVVHVVAPGKTVVGQVEKHAPTAAKAAIDFAVLTARLKPRPFKTGSN